MSKLLRLFACSVALAAWASATGTFRVREPPESLCPTAGDGMVGYYDFAYTDDDAKHLFFWFAESRGDPANDPLVLWMSGGPGASSVAFGLFEELGPCLIEKPGAAKGNEYAWNTNANVLFVDQPVRVGYSYSDDPVKTLAEATEDMYRFLTAFIAEYPRFATQDFYIIGESFGGTWVPALARAIDYKQSSSMAHVVRATSPGNASHLINLKGIGLGNAQLSQSLQWPGFYPTGCMGDEPLFNASACAAMEAGMAECVAMLEICAGSADVCGPVLDRCRRQSVFLILETGLNPYDFRKPCKVPGLCFEEALWVEEYLNSTEAREALGVPLGVQFSNVDEELGADFVASGDMAVDPIGWVEDLLAKDYRVLIYAGNKDWFCNAEGERRMADGIRWKHQGGFQAARARDWSVRGHVAGDLKEYGRLAFAEVYDAGHMVPADKPEEALFLINSWLGGSL
ncbi:carboxypeptidase Y [Colletotrichum tofieldiae]|uniref:carboxypeptidase C n=1 Tax=Colletotrichum tofieldiae TaxID=708197 RepID=A0A166T7K8_9PEZI|nr:carboxypeptidase Y [Colletotrichum tofieldiae]GKT71806.1 carboxypeptidase Y [Colletotrichum tofieldiae]